MFKSWTVSGLPHSANASDLYGGNEYANKDFLWNTTHGDTQPPRSGIPLIAGSDPVCGTGRIAESPIGTLVPGRSWAITFWFGGVGLGQQLR